MTARVLPPLPARLQRRSLQLRLALFYGGLFLLSGAVLLAIPNVLVRTSGSGLLVHRSIASIRVLPAGVDLPARKAISIEQRGADVHQQLLFSLVALAVMAVASFALGWLVAGRVLRPLRVITATAREISASNLHRRLGLAGPDDELRELGATLDDLLARLEGSFESQRRFVANASHELRTPLTAERTLLQLALSEPDPSVDSLRGTCEQLLVLGGQQERLIESLLTLANSERGIEQWDVVDLAAIVARVVASHEDDATSRDIRLDAAGGTAPTLGELRLMTIMVDNLLGNAIRYNRVGGEVQISTSKANGRSVLHMRNTGPTIDPAEIERLFQPFQRLDDERLESDGGHGLGLAIVRAIADAHRARLTVHPGPRGGLDVEVSFATSRR